MESTLSTGNLIEYCNYKIETAGNDTAEQNIWQFILASFVENKHEKFVQLLGLDSDNLKSKLDNILSNNRKEEHEDEQENVTLNGHQTEAKISNHFENSLHLNENGFDQLVNKNQEAEAEEEEDQIPIDFRFSSGERFRQIIKNTNYEF